MLLVLLSVLGCVVGFEVLFKVSGLRVAGEEVGRGCCVKGSPDDATTVVDGLTDWL